MTRQRYRSHDQALTKAREIPRSQEAGKPATFESLVSSEMIQEIVEQQVKDFMIKLMPMIEAQQKPS
jgi:hypothetical protein